jgi:hypothetical protein
MKLANVFRVLAFPYHKRYDLKSRSGIFFTPLIVERLENRRLFIGRPYEEFANGVTENQYPLNSIGQVMIDGPNAAFGTGTLLKTTSQYGNVAPQWVLTAAHVVEDVTTQDKVYFLRGGGVDANGRQTQLETLLVDRIVIHPSYQHTHPSSFLFGLFNTGQTVDTDHDLALLHLTRPAKNATGIAIYTGPVDESMDFATVGFGGTYNDEDNQEPDEATSGRMRVGFNDISDVSSLHYDIDRADGAFLIQGDSGGPDLRARFYQTSDGVRRQYELLGVHSAASKTEILGIGYNDDHNTRVDVYADWINSYAHTNGVYGQQLYFGAAERFQAIQPVDALRLGGAGAVSGRAFSGEIAAFHDDFYQTILFPNPDYTATIAWGDGTSSTGIVQESRLKLLSVSANHVYAHSGSYTATVTIYSPYSRSSVTTLVSHVVLSSNPVTGIRAQDNASQSRAVFVGSSAGIHLQDLRSSSSGEAWYQFDVTETGKRVVDLKYDESPGSLDLTIRNFSGQVVSQGQSTPTGEIAEVEFLAPGTYYAVINAEDAVPYSLSIGREQADVRRTFYVNDDSLWNNIFTTAAGSDLNSGLSPDAPKASIQAILDAYDLNNGDTIVVDTGTYALNSNIAITAEDAGVRISGPSDTGAILDRGDTAFDNSVFELRNADGVTLDHLTMFGGAYGIYAANFYTGGASGSDSDDLSIINCIVHDNAYAGVYMNDTNDRVYIKASAIYGNLYGVQINSGDATIIGDTVYGNTFSGIQLSTPNSSTFQGGVVGENEIYGNGNGIVVSVVGATKGYVIRDNVVYDNALSQGHGDYGISAYGLNVTVRNNTVFGQTRAGAVGIAVQGLAEACENVVFGNYRGIDTFGASGFYSSAHIVDNRVYGNSEIGIRAFHDSLIEGNVVYSNAIGIQGGDPIDSYSSYLESFSGTLANNLVYANSSGGILVHGRATSSTWPDTRLVNNTIYQPIGYGIQVSGRSRNVQLQNNLISVASGYALFVAADSQAGFYADYNNYHVTGTGRFVGWSYESGVRDYSGVLDWYLELGQELHGLAVDPQFIDVDGADNVLGYGNTDGGADDDFRVSSTSLTIDAGDPSSYFLGEPQANGGRINLGAYGNTLFATSSAAQILQLLSPAGLEKFERSHTVSLQWQSAGLTSNSTVALIDLGSRSGTGVWNGVDDRTPYYYYNDFLRYPYATSSTDKVVDTAGVANAAPEAVYRSYVASQYDLVAGYQPLVASLPTYDGTFTIRLHFVEPSYSAAGQRVFDICLNGTTVATDYDIYVEAGGAFKAVTATFTVTTSSGSGILLELIHKLGGGPILSGIELLAANPQGIASPTVNVEISADGGGSWSILAANLALDDRGRGDFAWVISTSMPIGADYQLRVTANNGSRPSDVSERSFAVVVDSANDSPILLGANDLSTITEDSTNDDGDTVAALIAGRVTDVDAVVTPGVALVGTSGTAGRWQYSLNGDGTWRDMGTINESSALLLRETDRIRFLPNGKTGTIASLSLVAWDQTAGIAGTKAAALIRGGTTAFSATTAVANLTVTALNDAPTLDATKSPMLAPVMEDAAAPVGKVGTLVTQLVDLAASVGQLDNVTDADSDAQLGIAVTGASTSGAWYYSLDDGGAWMQLGAVGVTGARLLAADGLTRIYFKPNANVNGTLNGVLAFKAWDRSTGANGGLVSTAVNGGTTAFSSTVDTASIKITLVNDAPTLDATKSPSLLPMLEDALAPTGPVGTLITNLARVSGSLKNVADNDLGALTGIAVIGADTSKGTWYYSLNNGSNWLALGNVGITGARLLAADAATRIYFKPKLDCNGTLAAALTFRAWDRTSGANGALLSTASNGGATTFSSATDTASIVVTAVNDAPVFDTTKSPSLAPVKPNTANPVGKVGTLIDALVHLSGSLKNVSDVDLGTKTGIAITAASTSGTWFYSLNNGSTWAALGGVSTASAKLLAADGATRLYFKPNANFKGTIASAITFRAWDRTTGTNGSNVNVGVGGGTTAFSATGDTATIVMS